MFTLFSPAIPCAFSSHFAELPEFTARKSLYTTPSDFLQVETQKLFQRPITQTWSCVLPACPTHSVPLIKTGVCGTRRMQAGARNLCACAACLRGTDGSLGIDSTPALYAFMIVCGNDWLVGHVKSRASRFLRSLMRSSHSHVRVFVYRRSTKFHPASRNMRQLMPVAEHRGVALAHFLAPHHCTSTEAGTWLRPVQYCGCSFVFETLRDEQRSIYLTVTLDLEQKASSASSEQDPRTPRTIWQDIWPKSHSARIPWQTT
ncbi:hypothetical protein BJY52DRAFT_685027 [Lactarius psammicola]|nr:hypothetical protein BJY52DRAFT_685027 [Lactarius psammicola]